MVCRIIKLSAISLLLLSAGCTYDALEDDEAPYTNGPGGPTGSTGPTGPTNITKSYAGHVVPILNAHCLNCHSSSSYNAAGGGINMQGYSNVITTVNNGSFLGSIKHQSGYVAMPYFGVQLSAGKINTIETWVNQGALNN